MREEEMGGGGSWRNAWQEVTNSKPLFVTIYATVFVGFLLSSFYVFSAVFVGFLLSSFYVFSAVFSFMSATIAASSAFSHVDSPYVHQSPNFLQPVTTSATGLPPSTQTEGLHIKPIWEVPSRNTEMPPLGNFRLTKELVGQRVKDNVIVVTFGNYAFMDFILTWVKHLTDAGISNFLVGAMDTKLLEALYWKGVTVFDMGSHMSTDDVGWGSPTFHKIRREK